MPRPFQLCVENLLLRAFFRENLQVTHSAHQCLALNRVSPNSQRPNSRNSADEIHPFILGIVITDGSLQVSKTLQGLVNAFDFEQSKHIEIIVFAICGRLSAFKSPSQENSIFLKIRVFFSFKFFQGHNLLTNYPDSEFHGH